MLRVIHNDNGSVSIADHVGAVRHVLVRGDDKPWTSDGMVFAITPDGAVRVSRARPCVINDYQKWAVDGARFCGSGTGAPEAIVYCALGLAGEAGEAADLVKKAMRGDHTGGYSGVAPVGALRVEGAPRAALVAEMGDVLYYLARLAAEVGVTMTEVIEANVVKVELRKSDGKKPDGMVGS